MSWLSPIICLTRGNHACNITITSTLLCNMTELKLHASSWLDLFWCKMQAANWCNDLPLFTPILSTVSILSPTLVPWPNTLKTTAASSERAHIDTKFASPFFGKKWINGNVVFWMTKIERYTQDHQVTVPLAGTPLVSPLVRTATPQHSYPVFR